MTYASYTKTGCDDVGIAFEIRHEHKLKMDAAVEAANADKNVHGIIVYYPVATAEHDHYIKDLVDPRKDIEGLNSYWARRLYHNERYDDDGKTKKSILPCTPLAVLKLLEAAGFGAAKPAGGYAGKTVTIFNRSEVVGRPLATMLANDGARVYSFDIDGPVLFRAGGGIEESKVSRREALVTSDIVITGVPTRQFELVTAAEIREGTVCVNFSTMKNFADDIKDRAKVFIPRVGPMTVAMALRNTVRLYRNYHAHAAP